MGKVRFDEIARECRETFKGSFTDMPIVGLEHIEPYDMKLKNYEVNVETTFTKQFHEGQILFGRRRAYQHKACVATFDGICSGDITVIEPIEGKVYPELLPFIIQNDDFFEHAIKGSNGALSPRVKWEHMANFELNLPSLAEQKVLAEKLWAAYEVKQSYLKMIEATEKMVKSQFIEMFDGDKYHQMELDSIAEVWLKGQAFKKDNICEEGTNFCIHYGELFTKYGPIIYDVSSTTNDEIMKASKSGDILFPASDVTPDGLARCSAIMRDEVLLGGDIIVLRPKQGNNPEYLSWAINMQKEQLLKRVTGSVVRHMSAKGLKTVQIPIAPIDKQKQFIKIVKQADKSVIELRKSVDAIDKVIKSLINENL